MEYETALNTENNDILTLDEIISSENLEFLRQHLKCPIKDCNADLIYVAASRHPFLSSKSHKTSPHNESCPHFRKETDAVNKKRNYERVLANLSESDISGRLDRLKDDMYPNRKKRKRETSKKREKSREKSKQADDDSGTLLIASVSGGVNPDEIKDKKVISRVPKKKFTEFLKEDEGIIYQGAAQLVRINKESNRHYDFVVRQIEGEKEAMLKLRDNFFKRNIVGINTWLDFLVDVLEDSEDIRIGFTGRFDSFKNCEFEIYDDFGFKLGKVDRGLPRLYTLAVFYNRYSNKK